MWEDGLSWVETSRDLSHPISGFTHTKHTSAVVVVVPWSVAQLTFRLVNFIWNHFPFYFSNWRAWVFWLWLSPVVGSFWTLDEISWLFFSSSLFISHISLHLLGSPGCIIHILYSLQVFNPNPNPIFSHIKKKHKQFLMFYVVCMCIVYVFTSQFTTSIRNQRGSFYSTSSPRLNLDRWNARAQSLKTEESVKDFFFLLFSI